TAGKILARQQEATRQHGPQDGISQLAQLFERVLRQADVDKGAVLGVGIGIPAVLERETDRVIWAPNLNGWRDVALKPALESLLKLPVYLEYDGHAAVLGEWWQGAARGFHSIVEIIIGTGIGGGMILEDRVVRGMNRLAGAAGWFALTTQPHAADSDDPSRSLGHWESLAAGPGIVRRMQAQLKLHPDSALADRAQTLTAKDVFDADDAGDPLARQIIDDSADVIGLGIANIVSLINPEIVVLGGSIGAQRGKRLIPRASAVVHSWAQPISSQSVTIVPSSLGADGGLWGAAYAVLQRRDASAPTRQAILSPTSLTSTNSTAMFAASEERREADAH
ncbi:MAG: ROK family protein, partial [Anaerolineae bacterium]